MCPFHMLNSAFACCMPADQYFVKAYNQINGNIEQRRETIASSAWKPALKVWCLARNMQRIGMEDFCRNPLGHRCHFSTQSAVDTFPTLRDSENTGNPAANNCQVCHHRRYCFQCRR
jgi:hypothetical protein